MLFTIHIDFNDHRVEELCIVFLGDFQHHEQLLSTVSGTKTCHLGQTGSISAVLLVWFCSVVVPLCEYFSICLLVLLPASSLATICS